MDGEARLSGSSKAGGHHALNVAMRPHRAGAPEVDCLSSDNRFGEGQSGSRTEATRLGAIYVWSLRRLHPVEGERTIRCSECDREITEEEAEREGWGYRSDGLGELHPFCPECAAREFGGTR